MRRRIAGNAKSFQTSTTNDPSLLQGPQQIAARAYELYEQRGATHGHDVDDWLQAERELVQQKAAPAA